jgi:hypothetical protein
MLALEDLADLGASLRGAGFKVSTPQLLAVQQLLLRLAAEGALPAQHEGLAGWLAPVLCTSAAEQRAFAGQYRAWLLRRFGTIPPPPPAAPPPAPRRWRCWAGALAVLVLLIGAGWLGVQWYVSRVVADVMGGFVGVIDQGVSTPSTPAPAPPAEAAGLVLVARVDLGATLPDPTLAERLQPGHLALALAAPALFVAWLLRWWRRRPVLQRIASRTPAQLRDVHLPGAAAALLPALPLRRLAQELRRRRLVDSTELQVEATVQATLRRGGLFTPVRGSHAEPDYLALIDRAHGADHQARLAGEVVAALARSDVLIERWDFDRDAGRLRQRAGRAAAMQGIDLVELHERHPEHRVLVFGDGAGCFDGFTGEPAPWTQTLAAWPLAVLLTPLAPARWGRREWVLQRLGIHVLPLDAAGLVVLMGLVGGLDRGVGATEPPPPAAPRHYEGTPRRWLERDPPPPASLEQLVAELRVDLGPRGMAWLAACAAYPEVHWGITLRLGAALVPDAAEFERLLPRIVSLVWFRAAYLPDWWRQRLLQELGPADEVLARRMLRRLLEGVARGGDELPLRIALGAPQAGRPWWQRLQRRLRARGDAQRAQDLLRTAPADSPLRDHVFLRFLSGASVRRLDLRAPAALLASLRSTRTAWPVALGGLALVIGAALAWWWPPLHRGEALRQVGPPQFSAAASSVAATATLGLARDGNLAPQRLWAASTRLALPAAGASALAALARDTLPASGRWQAVAPDGTRVAVAGAGRVSIRRFDTADGPGVVLEGAALAGDGIGTVDTTFSPDGSRFALREAGRIRVWDTADGRPLQTLDSSDLVTAADLEISADRRWLASGSVVSGARVWNLETGALQLKLESARTMRRVRFSPDSTQLAVETGNLLAGSGWAVEGWSLSSATPLWRREFEAAVTGLHYSPDGRWLAAWSAQRAPQLLRSADGAPGPALAEAGAGWLDLAFSPDGTRLAGIDAAGTVRLWDTASGAALVNAAGPQAGACCGAGLAFAADGRWLAGAAGGELALWAVPQAGAAAAPGVAYALVVGSDYPRSSAPLRGGVRDARAAAAVLRERYGFQVELLLEPSREALLGAFDKLAAAARAEDRLLIFLSGHGLRNADRGTTGYLATPPTRDFDTARDSIDADTIAQRLAALRAVEALLIVDASGGLDLAAGNAGQAVPARAVRSMISSYSSGDPLDAPNGSPFGRALEAALRAVGPGLTDRTLLDELTRRMAQDRTAGGQRPALRRMAGAGDNGGTFSFPAPLGDAASALPVAAASAPDALRQSLSEAVRSRIGAFCQRALAGRYPLDRRSAQDAQPEDFAQVFAPNGLMDSFFKEQLAPFVDTSSSPWRWRTADDGRVLGGDAAALRQFQRAAVIRDTFFRGGAAAASLRMRLTPAAFAPSIEMLTLNSNGQILRFVAVKPATSTLEWPGPRGTGPVMLQAEPTKDPAAGLRTDGPWALYRLFDSAEIFAGKAPEHVRAQFTLQGRRVLLDLNFDGTRNPLRLPELAEFACPTGL